MKTLVIGGGPAGMLSAYFKAVKGNDVTLVEKNEKLGKKLYITGKGRCNVLNDCSAEEFIENVVTNPKFLMGAIRRFSPADFKAFLEKKIPLKTERGNRVFPCSDKASDVTKCLESYLKDAKVNIRLNEKVLKIEKNGENFTVKTSKGEIVADEVVICTGGKSYPLTGSDGDGYKFAESLGHTIEKPIPALSGIETRDKLPELQGVSLKNVTLTAEYRGKKVFEDFGEMLFTHYGVSGPIVLTASSYINKLDFPSLKLYIDLKPALSVEKLDERLLRDFAKYKNKALKNSLSDLLIKSFIPVIIERSGVNGEKSNSEIKKEERAKLISAIKAFELTPTKLRTIEEAIITSGGVKVGEINPKNMESKIVKNLYFAGEVIDVDALTGGFNIMITACTAYSTSIKGGEK